MRVKLSSDEVDLINEQLPIMRKVRDESLELFLNSGLSVCAIMLAQKLLIHSSDALLSKALNKSNEEIKYKRKELEYFEPEWCKEIVDDVVKMSKLVDMDSIC